VNNPDITETKVEQERIMATGATALTLDANATARRLLGGMDSNIREELHDMLVMGYLLGARGQIRALLVPIQHEMPGEFYAGYQEVLSMVADRALREHVAATVSRIESVGPVESEG
jgi:hypothetical protein